jgi:hypothetical protein
MNINDPNILEALTKLLQQQQALVESQQQTAQRQLRLEQRLAAAASMPDVTHVDRAAAPAKESKKKAKVKAAVSLSTRILQAVRGGPKTLPELNEMLGYDTARGKNAIWGALRVLEDSGDVYVISRPGVRGKRGASVVYHSSHLRLLKPMPLP